ncbi:MAG: efflux RND transporter permease subunit, partial [bacterium]
MKGIGISGKIAKAFIKSKLTPLVVIASLVLGFFAVAVTPREEEPQIVVPMINVFAMYPGASSREVENRVTRPMEKLLWEIQGVEYVYSSSMPGMSLVIVRFRVGENMEASLVKLHNKLMSNYDRIPEGVSQPLVKPKSIDDVPILSFTLWSTEYTGYDMRRLAFELCEELKKDPDVSETMIVGGQNRQVRVLLNPETMRAYNVSPVQLMTALQQTNSRLSSGSFQKGNREVLVDTGSFLRDAEDVGKVVVGVYNRRPVYLKNIARIIDGPEEPSQYVLMGLGPGFPHGKETDSKEHGIFEAVSVTVSKKKGTNATVLAHRAIGTVEALKGKLIPSGIEITVTRNYGDTAKEKSDELLKHMLLATLSVIILIAFALGWRESVVVAVAVPVTLAFALLMNYLYGYTLNRVTLFALIFSIGILVDDAIVVVENIHRHFTIGAIDPFRAVLAVDEVGNPTILATFTVIAALLPMAFVSGLMGPYMRPIPVGASAAMIFSLLVAFIVSPWLSYMVLRGVKSRGHEQEEGGKLHAFYEKILTPFLEKRVFRFVALGSVGGLLGLAMLLVPLKAVTVKMLPFDNKSEVQVIIDMPEGTSLEQTALVAGEMGAYLKTVPEVTDFQLYVGTAAPFNFNGLVRHYFLRQGANVADIQVNFVSKHERDSQSHDIAKRIRPRLRGIGDRYGASIKIAEIPPGPPVLSTLVAEVYGPDPDRQIEIARDIRNVFTATEGVVDIDWYVEDDQDKYEFEVDREKAALTGVTPEAIAGTLRVSLAGASAGLVHMEQEKAPVSIVLRLPVENRSGLDALRSLTVPSGTGRLIPLFELVHPKKVPSGKT